MSAEDALSSDVAKLLTHVEGEIREKTVQKIVRYLKLREKSVGRLDDLELQRLWKALYYCFWMTDKVPVQLEMGRALAEMCRGFTRMDNVHAYFTNFFFVLRREWGGVDYLRMNKFLAWIRQMMNEWMLRMYNTDFDDEVVQNFVELLRDQVLLPHQSDGIRMQIAFVYLTELMNVAGPGLKEPILRELLSPFLCVLLAPPSEAFLQATIKDVFDMLNANEFLAASTGETRSFLNLDRSKVGAAIFDMAAADESLTAQRRKLLYALAKKFESRGKSSASKSNAGGGENEDDAEQARKKARLLVEEMERRKNSTTINNQNGAQDEEEDEMDVEDEEEEEVRPSKKNKKRQQHESVVSQKPSQVVAAAADASRSNTEEANNKKKRESKSVEKQMEEEEKEVVIAKSAKKKSSLKQAEEEQVDDVKKTEKKKQNAVVATSTKPPPPMSVAAKTPISTQKDESKNKNKSTEEEAEEEFSKKTTPSRTAAVASSKSDEQRKSEKKNTKTKTESTPKQQQQEEDNDSSNLDQSFVSTTSVSSKKSVRFSHKDIMRIPAINKRMKENQGKKAAELGQPTKSLLKKTSSLSPASSEPTATTTASALVVKKNTAANSKSPAKLSFPSSLKKSSSSSAVKKMPK